MKHRITEEINQVIRCQDARDWAKDSEHQRSVDLLLVNLPHSTLEHIEDLLPLMKRETLSLIRGWAIIERDELSEVEESMNRLLVNHGATDLHLSCQEVKGFSATKIFTRIESWQTFV